MARPRKTLDTTDHQIGQDGVVTMAVLGAPELDKPDIQIVDGPRLGDKAEILAFMNEPVTVTVLPSHDQQAPQIVEVWNGGIPQRFIRGKQQTVKRKYIEVLARAKPVTYRNEEYTDPAGNQAVRWPTSTGLMYPFQVHQDTQKGLDWLQQILAEAA